MASKQFIEIVLSNDYGDRIGLFEKMKSNGYKLISATPTKKKIRAELGSDSNQKKIVDATKYIFGKDS